MPGSQRSSKMLLQSRKSDRTEWCPLSTHYHICKLSALVRPCWESRPCSRCLDVCLPIYSTCQLQRKHRAPIFTPNQVMKRWKEIFWSQLEPCDGQQSILKDHECKLRPWSKWTRLFSFFCNPVVDSPPKYLSYGRLASKYELKHSCTTCTCKSQIHQQGSCRASSRSFGMVWEWPNSKGEEEVSEMKS